jgi:PAS domain S-box-containing protein
MDCNYFKEFVLDASKYNILIVENSKITLNLIKSSFKPFAYPLYYAKTALSAKDILDTINIHYVIVNGDISQQNEFELLEYIKNKGIKTFLLITAKTHKEHFYYKNGIVDYLDKNNNFEFEMKQLPQMIEQIERNKNRSILLIENDTKDSNELKMIFKNRNYDVMIEKNCVHVLEILRAKRIDLILLNVDIQEDNGMDFILQNKHYLLDELKICVLFVTQNITNSMVRDSLKMGVADVIKKPYIIEELILKVDMHINNKIESEKLICSTQLLQQYKNTVDRSSIVSKTDPRGVITYVNEAFCRISGYKEEELLGKPHNLVRHPDMKASVFKEMWNTIKKRKEPWIGEVKNQTKDGGAYWVQTIINPILDADGKILEYIGIRTDVTDIEKTKEYLQKQFSITKDNFADVMMLSKLYEEAMNKSNIILRVNKDKKVVYANDLFYKLMGYTPKELIGKPYSWIERPDDIKEEDIEKIWEGVEKNNIWKGELRNISKKGKMYHFISTVVPIKNAKGEILEYMGIRQDISQVVELHEELEATQREIVYKMGEIGETRSKETGNHVKRVAEYSKLLAELCGLSSKEADILFTASPMHDIGKVGIPDAILNKPGRLDDKEWKIMKTHSIIGYNILKNSKREVLKAAAIVAREHHEKWDGSGYPRKLKGEKIHIYGRITAIADVFDALGSDRCYKKAWEDEKIFKLLKEEKGKHFDPTLVDLFMKNVDEFKKIRDKYKD